MYAIDLGIDSAVRYFGEVVLPNIEVFEASPTNQFVMNAVQSLWNLLEWDWYDKHPDASTRGNRDYKAFCDQTFTECSEMAYIRDVAEAAKHRALERSPAVKDAGREGVGRRGEGGYGELGGGYGSGSLAYGSGKPERLIVFSDGSTRWLSDIVSTVESYWRKRLDFDRAVAFGRPMNNPA